MNEIKLSIIVPVYNVDKYLSKCLDSILNQHFCCDVEIICIDDGSTDNSGSICDEYSSKHSIIKVYHTVNKGVAEARNFGLKMSHGQYIAWIDSDDYISERWFSNVVTYLDGETDIIYYDMNIVFPNKIIKKHYKHKCILFTTEEFCNELMLGNIASHLFSKIIKRTLWNQINFNNKLSYCEDYDALHKIAVKAKQIIYVHEAIYYYVQRNDSIVNDRNNMYQNLLCGIYLAKQRYEYCMANNIEVPYIGVILSMVTFLWLVDKNKLKLARAEIKQYKFYFDVLKRNILEILFNKKITLKKKIQAVLVLFRVSKIISILF